MAKKYVDAVYSNSIMSLLSAAAAKLLSPLSVLSMSLCTFESVQLEAEVCYMSQSGLAALWRDRRTPSAG